ncbi:MAG: hypothetical protein AAGG51_16610 [Cyanobacteria bacterium P01_G01_bin.54]
MNKHKPIQITQGKRKRYLAALSDRALSYSYPFFLLALEWFLRIAFGLNTEEFIGPTLAATSVGMVIPLITFKSTKGLSDENGNKLSQETLDQLKKLEESGATYVSSESVIFSNVCFVVSLVFTLIWITTIVIGTESPVMENFPGIPSSYLLGFACFIVGLFLSEVKEFL